MKNLNYKWVLLLGAVLGFIVGAFNKDQWETRSVLSDDSALYRINLTTGEVWFWQLRDNNNKWKKS